MSTWETAVQKHLISYDLHKIFHLSNNKARAGKKYRFPGFPCFYKETWAMVRATSYKNCCVVSVISYNIQEIREQRKMIPC